MCNCACKVHSRLEKLLKINKVEIDLGEIKMTKKQTLEAISYKTKRVKFGGNWFPVDPFLNLDPLKINQQYEAEFKLDRGVFYIDSFKETDK